MKVITIESEAYQQLLEKIEKISIKLDEVKKQQPLSEIWLDNQDLCHLLGVSKRTVQHYRDSRKLAYSQINAKIYYKASEVERFLNDHYVTTDCKNKKGRLLKLANGKGATNG